MKTSTKAFTLIELMLSLSIVSILLGGAIPSFSNIIENTKVDSNLQTLTQTLQLSRISAITENSMVTLCPSSSGMNCDSNWSSGYISFIDHNGDRQLNEKDTILTQVNNIDKKLVIYWKVFGNKKSLQWLSTGITNHQNGSFILCYNNKKQNARGLFITKAGRVRFSKDSNNDEIHENAVGKAIKC